MTVAEQTIEEHWGCVTQGLSEVFTMACGSAIEPQEGADPASEVGGPVLLSVVSLVGDLEWTCFLGLPQPTAEALAQAFSGFEIPFDSEDMGDAVGELANLFGGGVKALLDKKGVKVEISLPSVMRGDNLHMLPQKGFSIKQQVFQSPHGPVGAGVMCGKFGAA